MPNEMPRYRLSDIARAQINMAVLKQRLGDVAGADAALQEALETFAAELEERLVKVLTGGGPAGPPREVAKAPHQQTRGEGLFPDLERERAAEKARRVAWGLESPTK